MKFDSKALIQDLRKRTQANLLQAQEWLNLPLSILQYKPNPATWSMLECLEHLNLYGDFYLPEIKQQISKSTHQTPTAVFKSSWLGNYFAKAVGPQEPLNTMKTFRDKDANGSPLDKQVVDKFISQQQEMLRLLERGEQVNMTKIKTSITISKWIRLRLGDTFRVVIYHNDRHIIQARNVLQHLQNKSSTQLV